jgi:DNA-binding NarL/FixJ family response regulator
MNEFRQIYWKSLILLPLNTA